MSQAIEVTSRYELLELLHVLVEGTRYTSRLDLRCFAGAIQHFRFTTEVVNRTQHEIEPFPIFLYPVQPVCRGCGIIVKFDPGQDLHIRIQVAQMVNHRKINAGDVTVMISESDAPNALCATLFDPRLQ